MISDFKIINLKFEIRNYFAFVAQSVEHVLCKNGVMSSSLIEGSTLGGLNNGKAKI